MGADIMISCLVFSYLIDGAELHIAVGQRQYFGTIGSTQKFAFVVQQLESIPVFRVVAGSEDDATTGFFQRNGYLYSRGGTQAEVHHIDTDTLQGAANKTIHHLTADTCISSHHHHTIACFFNDPAPESCGKPYDICRS